MSDDQSFYEIQLNTPHLVLAFLGAAVVGVAIFWLGVVIGRGQSDVPGSSEWQSAVPADDAAASNDAEEEPFGFYEAVEEPAAQPPAGDDPAAATDPAATDPAVTEPTIPPVETPEQETGAAEFQPAERDPDEPEAGEIVADSGGGIPENDPSLTTGWIVQVRAFPDMASANALQASLADAGFPAFVVSADVRGETLYRVRVGRYRSQADAQVVERMLEQRSDISDTWVTQG